MRNCILKKGILIMTGALALGACGGRKDDRPTTAQPELTEPAPPPPDTQQPDTAGQDMTGATAPGQDTADTATPGQHMGHEEMTGQEPGMGMQGQGTQDQGMGMQGQQGGQGMAGQGTSGQCPTDVQGTIARTEESPEGVAIAFTTTGDVAAVRLRVQRLADLHNERHAQRMQGVAHDQAGAQTGKKGAKGKKGKAGAKGKKGKAGTQDQTAKTGPSGMPGEAPDVVIMMTQARAEDTPDGARLVLTVMEPAQIESMREPLRTHAQTMASAQCDSMSEMQDQGATPGTTSQPAGQGTPGQPRTR